jgi:hypothetical protein
MRFLGPEEGGIFAVLRTPRLGLVGIFAAGSFPPDDSSLSEGGGKEGMVVAKVCAVAHKGKHPLGAPH